MIWYAPLSASVRLTVQAGVFDDEDDVDGIATETKIEVSHHLVWSIMCPVNSPHRFASRADSRLRKIPLRLHNQRSAPNDPLPTHTPHRFLNDLT